MHWKLRYRLESTHYERITNECLNAISRDADDILCVCDRIEELACIFLARAKEGSKNPPHRGSDMLIIINQYVNRILWVQNICGAMSRLTIVDKINIEARTTLSLMLTTLVVGLS